MNQKKRAGLVNGVVVSLLVISFLLIVFQPITRIMQLMQDTSVTARH